METAKVNSSRSASASGDSALARCIRLQRRLYLSDARTGWTILAMIAAVFTVILLNTYGQLQLNRWQGSFYDAIGRKDWTGFLHQLLRFLYIAGALLVLVVLQNWTTELTKVKARGWLAGHLVRSWLAPKRAYLLGFAGEVAENPDQRISQDANRLTDLSISFLIGLGQNTMLLVTFVGVLWTLSNEVVLNFNGKPLVIPGYMVWCTLAFSGFGSILTYLIGRPLVPWNAERYSREGEFRTQLMRASGNAAAISLERGEEVEARSSALLLEQLLAAMRKIANLHARVTWLTSGYGWTGLVFPIIVAAPGYFFGTMTLGTLMMVVGAFHQVQNALRWYIDNYPSIADWHAVLNRVDALDRALVATGDRPDAVSRISFATDGPDLLSLENLAVCLPGDMASCIIIGDRQLDVKKGERVLFTGAAGSGKTTFAMALAGLWPWGRGTIRHPAPFNALFLSERPYVPQGTLLQALAYPLDETAFASERAAAALADAGLPSLAGRLAEKNHWDRDLSLSEQQRMGIARLLIHAPDWAVLDNCLSALDDRAGLEILALLKTRLPHMGVIAMSDRESFNGYFSRKVPLGGRASLQPFTLVDGVARVNETAT